MAGVSQSQQVQQDAEFAFLDSVSAGWTANSAFSTKLPLNNTLVQFKIDTGADVSIIPDTLYSVREHGPLQKSDKVLTHAGGTQLECTGRFTGKINYNGKAADQEIYVVRGAERALLGKPAIKAFDLVHVVHALNADASTPQHRHPKLFAGLGKIPGEYEVELLPDAKPFAVA